MGDFGSGLGGLAGGRVLDLATGGGQFAAILADCLGSYEEIVGLDSQEKARAAFAKAFEGKAGVRFELGDATALGFADASFDTVAVSNSLHHFADPAAPLREAFRVLKPGGALVVSEMYRDSAGEEARTHVLLHHFWAAIDTATGTFHRETYAREELLALVRPLGLEGLAETDIVDGEGDPRDPETLAFVESTIDQYLGRAAGLADRDVHGRRGDELRRRLREVGFRSADCLLLVGRKPPRGR